MSRTRIELSLTVNYCPGWGLWEGVREIVQNAVDDEEWNGGKMVIEHSARAQKLSIKSQGVVLERSVLLLGASDKKENERGHFGEGLKIGVLALVRSEHPVIIYNGDEVWRPVIEPSEQFAGSNVLCFQTRKLPKSRADFTVEVENISKPVWEQMKAKFLFLSPDNAADTVKVRGGTILLAPDRKGEVYVKGIYVNDVPELDCGYDLERMELDRDRRLIDTWNLKDMLGKLWVAAQQEFPERVAARLYTLAANSSADADHLHYYADEKLVAEMWKTLEKHHGAGVMPVPDAESETRLNRAGIRTVVVSKALHKMLERAAPSVDKLLEEAGREIKEEFSPAQLTDAEQPGLALAQWLFPDGFKIVEFNDGKPLVRWNKALDAVAVARSALTLPARELLKALVGAKAAPQLTTDTEVFIDLLLPYAPGPMRKAS